MSANPFRRFENSVSRVWMRLAVGGLLFTQVLLVQGETPDDVGRLKERVAHLIESSRWLDAAPLAERLVTLTIEQHGKDSLETGMALHYWAFLVQRNGDYDKAEQLWLRSL